MGSSLVLGSASPRRRELLGRLDIDFVVKATELDEAAALVPGDLAGSARAIAEAKYHAVVDEHGLAPTERLLTADTLVGVSGVLLAKPADRSDARWMLGTMAGRRLEIVTAVCFGIGGQPPVVVDLITEVQLRPMTGAEIEAYVAGGEGDDKAGAIGLQGDGAAFVERVDGCWSNVAGLPLCVVDSLLGDTEVECSVDRCGSWRDHKTD